MRWSVNKDGTKNFISLYDNRGTSTNAITLAGLNRSRRKFLKETIKLQNIKLNPEFFKGTPDFTSKTDDEIATYIVRSFIIRMLIQVANGNVFRWPGEENIRVYLKYRPIDEVKRLYDLGLLKNIDLYKSGFKYPLFVINFGTVNKKEWRIHVPEEIQLLANSNLENGLILKDICKYDTRVYSDRHASGDARDIPRSGRLYIKEQY